MRTADHTESFSFVALANRCQAMVDRMTNTCDPAVVRELRTLVAECADGIEIRDRLMVRSLLTQVFGRVASLVDPSYRSALWQPFMGWAASAPTSANWRGDAVALLDRWIDSTNAAGCHSPRGRVERALGFLDSRYRDSTLKLADVAAEMNLSVWHAARMLKQQTGRGFGDHVHSRRVAEGQRLLRETAASVKEIASVVGYGTSSQLDRHFRKLCRITPAAYRRRMPGSQNQISK
jgi:AraC-like DNA-binding protein